ncbi:15177_t:CDS:2, partial [Gigaspora margarita]
SNFARFHIMLLSIRWCKDEVTESEHAQKPFLIASCNTKLAPVMHQLSSTTNMLRINNIQENKAHGHVKKKLRFTKTTSLTKKAITLQEDNENNYELKHQNSRDIPSIQIDNEQLISIEDIADPAYHIGKGAPCKNRIKGEQEKYQEKKKSTSKPR